MKTKRSKNIIIDKAVKRSQELVRAGSFILAGGDGDDWR
jgi:hypothetical protein